MQKLLLLPLCAALSAALSLSCATNSEVYHKVDGEVAHSNFAAAAREIDAAQASRKPIYPAKNAVLLSLDKGKNVVSVQEDKTEWLNP